MTNSFQRRVESFAFVRIDRRSRRRGARRQCDDLHGIDIAVLQWLCEHFLLVPPCRRDAGQIENRR